MNILPADLGTWLLALLVLSIASSALLAVFLRVAARTIDELNVKLGVAYMTVQLASVLAMAITGLALYALSNTMRSMDVGRSAVALGVPISLLVASLLISINLRISFFRALRLYLGAIAIGTFFCGVLLVVCYFVAGIVGAYWTAISGGARAK